MGMLIMVNYGDSLQYLLFSWLEKHFLSARFAQNKSVNASLTYSNGFGSVMPNIEDFTAKSADYLSLKLSSRKLKPVSDFQGCFHGSVDDTKPPPRHCLFSCQQQTASPNWEIGRQFTRLQDDGGAARVYDAWTVSRCSGYIWLIDASSRAV